MRFVPIFGKITTIELILNFTQQNAKTKPIFKMNESTRNFNHLFLDKTIFNPWENMH